MWPLLETNLASGRCVTGLEAPQPMGTLVYLGKWGSAARTWEGVEGAWRVR